MTASLPQRESRAEIRLFRRHQHLVREGEAPGMIFCLEDGWACRYRSLSGGRRQITGLFLPGDYCEPQWLLGDRTKHPIVALTALRARGLPLAELAESPVAGSDAMTTMLSATLRIFNRQSEWIVALGRQNACERLCGLLCDIFERMRGAGRVFGNRCPMPLTQADLADLAGLTPVHVNRVLKQLRTRGVIELRARSLRVPDPERLRGMSLGLAPLP
jgi:CRP-like cAMP-binding protein